MVSRTAKLITVPLNGQISIGSSWAGKQVRVEKVNENEIRILAGVFVPSAQKIFFTKEALQTLDEFNIWESKNPTKGTDTEALFAKLKKKKRQSGK